MVKEGGREGGRKGRREEGKEGGREGGSKGRREGGKEGGEGGKVGVGGERGGRERRERGRGEERKGREGIYISLGLLFNTQRMWYLRHQLSLSPIPLLPPSHCLVFRSPGVGSYPARLRHTANVSTYHVTVVCALPGEWCVDYLRGVN